MQTLKATLQHIYKSAEHLDFETREITKGEFRLHLIVNSYGGIGKNLIVVPIPDEKVYLYIDKEGEEVEVTVMKNDIGDFYGI